MPMQRIQVVHPSREKVARLKLCNSYFIKSILRVLLINIIHIFSFETLIYLLVSDKYLTRVLVCVSKLIISNKCHLNIQFSSMLFIYYTVWSFASHLGCHSRLIKR